MSNYEYEDDDDFDSGDLVKQLRKANKQKERELAELREQFQQLNKAQRERTLSETLAARGVNPKIAKFIPEDIADATAVDSWLAEYGDVFGVATAEAAKPNVSPEDAAAMKRMQATVDGGVTPEATQDVMNKLLSANSKEELDEIIRTSGL